MAATLADLEQEVRQLKVEVHGLKLGLEIFLTAKQQEEFWAEVTRMKKREDHQRQLREQRRNGGIPAT